MRAIRDYLSWIFAITSFVCFKLAFFGPRHVHSNTYHARALLSAYSLSFMVLALIFGMAWFTTWQQRRFARAWAIIASLIHTVVGLGLVAMFVRFSTMKDLRMAWEVITVPLVVGVMGLVAFSRRWERPEASSRTPSYQGPPGDGTNAFLNKTAVLLTFVLSFAALWWAGRWIAAKGIQYSYGAFSQYLMLALVALTITTLHELGHAVTGLALGMKLRAFVAGPFQWQIRSGKWEFKFKPSAILAVEGSTGAIPTTPDFPQWREVLVTAAGPFVNLFSGIVAVSIAFGSDGSSPLQVGGFLILFGAWSLITGACNLLPIRAGDNYSDGARIYQSLSNSPWTDFRRVMNMVQLSAITAYRHRDFDIEAIRRVGITFAQGKSGLLLRLFAFEHFLDRGNIPEAGKALKEAEAIYHQSALDIRAELHTVFVFGNAYVLRDSAAAREWWTRMEAKKPTHFNVDYWRAASALHWIEGNLNEANEAWEKANACAVKLPNAGAYEFDRYCCNLLRHALDEVPVAQ
jgi:hypothetical protein